MYRLELPHRRIHAIANNVLAYAEHGEADKAKDLILQSENGDLRTVVNLFEEARAAFRESQKELAVVLTNGRKHLALTVDSVAAVEVIAEDSIEDPATTGGLQSDLISKAGQRAHGKGIVFVLDAERLLS